MIKQKQSGTKKTNLKALAELDALSEKFGKLAARDVSDVIGVLYGVKPAAMIGGDNTCISKDVLNNLGLQCVSSTVEDILYISYDKEMAIRLSNLHERAWDDPMESFDEHREIGKLLGYPDTAVEYYLERLKTLDGDNPLPQFRPPEVEGTISRRFQRFILSPGRYQEEVKKYCLPLEEATRAHAPKTYEALCALSSRS